MDSPVAMPAVSYPIEILHLTDPHIMPVPGTSIIGIDTADSLALVLQQALYSGQNFDLCLVTGDLVQTACEEAYLTLLSILQRYQVNFTCLPGNHDNPALMRHVLASPTVNCEKQQFIGNWQIICLDSSQNDSDAGYLTPGELSFLENCLAENPGLFTLVAVHHHCIPSESRWMDTMIIKNADEFLSLLDRYPRVKVVINGHIHQVLESTSRTLKILSTPSTCFQFEPHSVDFKLDTTMPAYRRLQLYADGEVVSQVIRLASYGVVD